MEKISFQQIFDANVSTLTEYSQLYEGKTSESFYIDIVLTYMTADEKSLEKIFQKFKSLSEMPFQNEILTITELRILARRGALTKTKCEQFLFAIDTFDELWMGEAYFMLALCYAKLKLYLKAKEYFKTSFIHLKNIGCKRKVLLAFQNFLAGISNSEPNISLISEYLVLIKEAKRLKFFDIEALTLLNLSREFQDRNATLLALDYCVRAEQLGRENLGSLQYWLIIAHKADLLIELKRIHEATLVYEELMAAENIEIKQSIEVLKVKLESTSDKYFDKAQASPTWEERLTESKNRPKKHVGELEQKLIGFILEKPRTKQEIVIHLYGSKLDKHMLDSRFKKLISKARKKIPGIIVYHNGLYSISDSKYFQIYQDAK